MALFRSLGDASRLTILQQLAAAKHPWSTLGLAQSTVSAHLACLRDCGLVAVRPQGRQRFYALTHRELMDLLRAAEVLLTLTGDGVSLCRSATPRRRDCRTRHPKPLSAEPRHGNGAAQHRSIWDAADALVLKMRQGAAAGLNADDGR